MSEMLRDEGQERRMADPKRVAAKRLVALIDGQTLDGYDPIHTGEMQYGVIADTLIEVAEDLLRIPAPQEIELCAGGEGCDCSYDVRPMPWLHDQDRIVRDAQDWARRKGNS